MKTFKEIEELKNNKDQNNSTEIKEGNQEEPQLESELYFDDATDDQSQQYALKIDTSDIIELILKDQPKLHEFLRIPFLQSSLLPRFLTVSLVGYVLYGLIISLVLTVTGYWPTLISIESWLSNHSLSLWEFNAIDSGWGKISPWINGKAMSLIFAYAFGLIATSSVCLPSLYFYSLLAGVKMSMVEVVSHAVKCKAVSAVALIGILPIYVAIAMGAAIFSTSEGLISITLFLGLLLPFISGMWGTVSLYRAFAILAESIPTEDKLKRTILLDRLVLSWSVCYTAVMPVMVYTVWQKLLS